MKWLIGGLTYLAQGWIHSYSSAFSKLGQPLSEENTKELAAYFESDILREVRIIFLDQVKPFKVYTQLKLFSLKCLFQIWGLGGLTLHHCIFLRKGMASAAPQVLRSILFHELVHVVQYEILGVIGFLRSYLSHYRRTREYFRIPHEQIAYSLQRIYGRYRDEPFAVRPVIERWGRAQR